MRAVVHTEYGPPEVLRFVDIERPTPQADEVLIEVHTAAVNRTDTGCRAANPVIARAFTGLWRPRQTILGTEVAGRVIEVGGVVTKFAVGDRVFGVHAEKFGSHAEYLTMSQDAPLATMPASMSFEEGAALCDGMILAVAYLRSVHLRAGQRILIYGASGAIGTAAVQLARHLRAHVTAVCTTKNLDLMRSLGADEVIDYTVEDFTGNGQTYDVVYDAVGKHSFLRCLGSLVPGGVFMSTDLGFLWQNPFLALLTGWLPTRRAYFPLPRYEQADVLFLKGLFEAGEYRAVIDRCYAFDEIVAATTYVESEQKTGNVVLRVRSGPS